MTFFVRIGLALLALAGIVGLAWMPSPFVRDLSFVPRPLAELADANDFGRNVVGGAVLQAAVIALGWRLFRRAWRPGWWLLAGWGTFAALEAAQVFLPARYPDWNDVVAGGFGAVGVLAAAGFVRWMAKPPGPSVRSRDDRP